MNNLATCSVCGAEKETGEFYSSTLRKDGGVGQCRACVCARVKMHRRQNIDTFRAYDRERSRLPHRIANATRVTREWRRAHRDRQRAHNKVARTPMVAPALCEGCGLPKRLDKHHHDYSRPLLVVWLCKPCHIIADKLRRKLEAS
jgi:hypothetical protein